MEMQGYMNPVSAIEYTHFEDDWLHEVVRTAQAGSAAPGDTVVGAVAVDSFAVQNQNSPYIATGSTDVYTPRDQDILMFPDRTLGLVTNVS